MASVAQLVELLICNQWVGGSSPSAGSTIDTPGGVPERPKGTDCKSVGEAFGGSNPPPTTSRVDRVDVGDIRFRSRLELHGFGMITAHLVLDYSLAGNDDGESVRLKNGNHCGNGKEAGVAQLVELQPSKLNVASSSLVSRSSFVLGCTEPLSKENPKTKSAHVAQSVERFLGKEEVHRFDSDRGLHCFCFIARMNREMVVGRFS